MRKYLRRIAKARMKALGIDRVNRKMRKGAWRKVLTGELGKQAELAQLLPGKMARKEKARRASA